MQEPNQNIEAEEQSEIAITQEVVLELLELLGNQKNEVRHGTLSAILQYTPTPQAKLMFKDTTLMSYLRKYIFQPPLTKICLSTLIHFATESQYLPEYFKLIEPLTLKLKQWNDLERQLALLLLLNISKQEQIVVRLLGQQDKKGYLMEVLYALMQQKDKMRWIIVGVFVNISSIDRGRKFLVQEGMGVRFVQYISNPEQKLREASLKITRNCVFEWQHEPFLADLFKPQRNFFPTIIKLQLFLIFHQQLVHDTTYTKLLMRKFFQEGEAATWQKRMVSSSKAKALAQLELLIDIMLILANCELKNQKTGVDSEHFKELLGVLKFTEIKEETKDKLEALEIFGI